MKKIVNMAVVSTAILFIIGCSGSNGPAPKSSGLDLSGKTIYIKSDAAKYSSNSRVAQNIKSECHLDTKLITFITEEASAKGMTVKVSDNIPADAIELKVEITDAISSGNAFIGHRKVTSISGNLLQSGKSIGTFEAARQSGGGMFAQFKGSCAVLGRTVKTLGSDVSNWMVKPSEGAALGDTRLIPRR
jgi:hypothetical protein